MQTLSLKTKKQIVLSRIIYDYIINGLSDSLDKMLDEDKQLFIMRVNIQAITHAIDISQEEEIRDFEYCFNQLGVSFNITIPLSQAKFSTDFIDEHIKVVKEELGDDFESMVTYLKKMETPVV